MMAPDFGGSLFRRISSSAQRRMRPRNCPASIIIGVLNAVFQRWPDPGTSIMKAGHSGQPETIYRCPASRKVKTNERHQASISFRETGDEWRLLVAVLAHNHGFVAAEPIFCED